MAFATSGVIAPPRIPWRFLAVAALLVVLTLAGLVYTGFQPRPPAPFGRAENGLIAYGASGDILTVDLASGARRAVVTGPTIDHTPRFSRDGSRIAFLRETAPGMLLAVSDVDGGNQLVLTPEAFAEIDPDSVVWSPDGRSIAISVTPLELSQGAQPSVYLADTAGGGVRKLNLPYQHIEPYWRPPDGRQLAFFGRDAAGSGLFLVSIADGEVERLAVPSLGTVLRPLGWTPDGRRLAYQVDDDPGGARTRILDLETGAETVLPVAQGHISNDGTRVVGPLDNGQMCVVPIGGGPCDLIGDPRIPLDGGWTMGVFWSPDDQQIVAVSRDTREPYLMDPGSGRQALAPWVADGGSSWQRR
jgi:dipeptidyl aminopeptidase/acylaminoacyl peptidase